MEGSEISHLIAQLKAGKNESLEYIILEYKDWCVNGLLKKTDCDPDDAHDIFIEAVLNLRERILSGKLDQMSNMKNYLYGTCYNMWLNSYKKRKKQSAILSDIDWYYQEQAAEFGMEESEVDFWKNKMLAVAKEAMSKLGQNCQKIITYFYIERRSMRDIAELLNFSSAAVAKTTKSRCFKKLMEVVEQLQDQ